MTLMAPASKADVTALGTSVALTCVCKSGLQPICPYCIGRAHLADTISLFGITSVNDLANKPLFPSHDMSWCSKAGVIHSIEALASAAGEAPHTRRGAEKWGGHAYRRGGAHLLAALGLSREDIKAIARHSSNAVDAYLEGADFSM